MNNLCWCGGVPVAFCIECNAPLCSKHAGNPYKPKRDKSGNTDFDKKVNIMEDPVLHNVRIKVVMHANQLLLEQYGERNVCPSCHLANLRKKHGEIIERPDWPTERFEFLMWVALQIGCEHGYYCVRADDTSPLSQLPFVITSSMAYLMISDLPDEEIVSGWLRFAKRASILPDAMLSIIDIVVSQAGPRRILGLITLPPREVASERAVQVPAWHFVRIHYESGGDYDFRNDTSGPGPIDYDGYITNDRRVFIWDSDRPVPAREAYRKVNSLYVGVRARIAQVIGEERIKAGNFSLLKP
jgi:hypothetical protein